MLECIEALKLEFILKTYCFRDGGQIMTEYISSSGVNITVGGGGAVNRECESEGGR